MEGKSKIKIFWGGDITDLETEVNEFIKDKQLIDVRFSSDDQYGFGVLVRYRG